MDKSKLVALICAAVLSVPVTAATPERVFIPSQSVVSLLETNTQPETVFSSFPDEPGGSIFNDYRVVWHDDWAYDVSESYRYTREEIAACRQRLIFEPVGDHDYDDWEMPFNPRVAEWRDCSPYTNPEGEYQQNHALTVINASSAFHWGITGRGSRIFIAGLDNGSVEKMQQIISAPNDGEGMLGVAYDAEPVVSREVDVPFRIAKKRKRRIRHILNETGNIFDRHAEQINGVLLLGFAETAESVPRWRYRRTLETTRNKAKKLLANQWAVVAAAGDIDPDALYSSGRKIRSVVGSLPGRQKWDGWITVGAVDEHLKLAENTVPAGNMKDYYIVAPGYTAFTGASDGYSTNDAAAYVAGALALMEEQFGSLKHHKHVDILLNSATDLGAPGVDDTYGHGLLNLDKALQPRDPFVPCDPGAAGSCQMSFEEGTLEVPYAIAAAIRESGALDEIGIQDYYGRIFLVDGSNLLYSNASTFSFDNYQDLQLGSLQLGFTDHDPESGHSLMTVGLALSDNLSFRYGYEDGVLGSDSLGDTQTQYYRVSYKSSPDSVRYGIDLDYGYASGSQPKTLIHKVSDLHMLGFGLSREEQYKDGDKFRLSLISPLSITSGSLGIRTVTGQDRGNLFYQDSRIDLSGADREYDLHASYVNAISENASLTLNAGTSLTGGQNRSVGVSLNYDF